MYIIFDTETTGLPKNFKAPITDTDNWPRCIQIAWQLHDEWGTLIESKDYLVKPDGFNIPYDAEQIHGISTELAEEQGVVEESLSKLQADMGKLQDKLVEARAKQKSLIVRERSVAVRMTVKNRAHSVKIDDAIIRFEQYERRIDDLESQVDAYDLVNESQSLNAQFNQLEAESQIEQELEALRKKVA